MKKLLVVICLFIAPHINAASQATENSAVNQLLQASGINTQLESLPALIQAQFAASFDQGAGSNKPSKAEFKAINSLLANVYSANNMEKAVAEYIAQNMSKADIDNVMSWLKSPTGEKITLVEINASTAKGYASMMQYAQNLATNPPNDEYLNKIEQLATNINAINSSVNMAINVQIAITSAMAIEDPNLTEDKLKFIISELDKSRPAITNSVTQNVIVSMLFTYKSLPTDDLDQYIAFTATKVGSRYYAVVITALDEALSAASKELGKGLMELMKSQPT